MDLPAALRRSTRPGSAPCRQSTTDHWSNTTRAAPPEFVHAPARTAAHPPIRRARVSPHGCRAAAGRDHRGRRSQLEVAADHYPAPGHPGPGRSMASRMISRDSHSSDWQVRSLITHPAARSELVRQSGGWAWGKMRTAAGCSGRSGSLGDEWAVGCHRCLGEGTRFAARCSPSAIATMAAAPGLPVAVRGGALSAARHLVQFFAREHSGVLEGDVERGDGALPTQHGTWGSLPVSKSVDLQYAFLQRANCEIAASTVAGHAGVRSARPARAGTTSTASPADPRNPTRAGIRPELQRHRRNGRSRTSAVAVVESSAGARLIVSSFVRGHRPDSTLDRRDSRRNFAYRGDPRKRVPQAEVDFHTE